MNENSYEIGGAKADLQKIETESPQHIEKSSNLEKECEYVCLNNVSRFAQTHLRVLYSSIGQIQQKGKRKTAVLNLCR